METLAWGGEEKIKCAQHKAYAAVAESIIRFYLLVLFRPSIRPSVRANDDAFLACLVRSQTERDQRHQRIRAPRDLRIENEKEEEGGGEAAKD